MYKKKGFVRVHLYINLTKLKIKKPMYVRRELIFKNVLSDQYKRNTSVFVRNYLSLMFG